MKASVGTFWINVGTSDVALVANVASYPRVPQNAFVGATAHHDIILFVVQMGFFTKTIVNFTAKHV